MTILNNSSVALKDIPVLEYKNFFSTITGLFDNENMHCANYYAFPYKGKLKFISCMADDAEHTLHLLSHELDENELFTELDSLSAKVYQMHIFEREISENFGIGFTTHPFLKPVRFPANRFNKDMRVNDYPFYRIDSDELHEVGVGPIHAGIIEPGHFRFLCNGEMVLHLEIQLGWQHRGIEQLFIEKKKLLQRNALAESIAGDTAIGHNLAFCYLAEAAAGIDVTRELEIERTIALEFERIAMYVFDMSNMYVGLAYQLGNSVLGALRTPIINFLQHWCGNRFGKSLIRVGGTNYPLNNDVITRMKNILDDFEVRFNEISDHSLSLPSVLKRFEGIGRITRKQCELIGAVGLTARMNRIRRDIRYSHPFAAYKYINVEPVVLDTGDVLARFMLRRKEISKSIEMIRALLDLHGQNISPRPIVQNEFTLQPERFVVSLVEGWRGEICHCAVTDGKGEIIHYKVKDPSLHNWMALALSLRNLEISDFPINNKSYNLSYCGHDL